MTNLMRTYLRKPSQTAGDTVARLQSCIASADEVAVGYGSRYGGSYFGRSQLS